MQVKQLYRFGDFVLHATERVLMRGGSVIPLTPKAVDTLLALVEKAPEVVEKEALMARVWPDTHVSESGLLRNISVVRKALGGDDAEYIETVSKRGYRFVIPVVHEEITGETSAAVPNEPTRSWWPKAAAAIAVIALAGVAWWTLATKGSAPDRAAAKEPPASSAYLIGRHIWNRSAPGDLEKSLRQFDEAIAQDPNSAIAHAGRADALLSLVEFAGYDPRETTPEAKRTAARAVKLGPRLGAAHAAHARALLFADWDWEEAEREYRRAVELDPRDIRGYYGYGHLLLRLGRYPEARSIIERGQKIDPVSPLLGVFAGYASYANGEFDRAATELRQVIEREPAYSLAHYFLALTYGSLSRWEEAGRHADQAGLVAFERAAVEAWLAARRGRAVEARAHLTEIESRRKQGAAVGASGLVVAAALNDWDTAAEAFRRGVLDRDPTVLNIRADARLASFRADPRSRELLRKIGL